MPSIVRSDLILTSSRRGWALTAKTAPPIACRPTRSAGSKRFDHLRPMRPGVADDFDAFHTSSLLSWSPTATIAAPRTAAFATIGRTDADHPSASSTKALNRLWDGGRVPRKGWCTSERVVFAHAFGPETSLTLYPTAAKDTPFNRQFKLTYGGCGSRS